MMSGRYPAAAALQGWISNELEHPRGYNHSCMYTSPARANSLSALSGPIFRPISIQRVQIEVTLDYDDDGLDPEQTNTLVQLSDQVRGIAEFANPQVPEPIQDLVDGRRDLPTFLTRQIGHVTESNRL